MKNKLSIKQTLLFYLFVFVSLASVTIWFMLRVVDSVNRIDQFNQQTTLAKQASSLLRQSSDDLTKFARLYAITLNSEYLNNFYQIIAIRKGTAPLPDKYYNVYWDLSPELRRHFHPDSSHQSFNSIISQLDLTDIEINKLLDAERFSEQLVLLEEQAFNALKGLFKNPQGSYEQKGEPDQKLALELLSSDKYLRSKENIMLQIDGFINLQQSRYEKINAELRQALLIELTSLAGLVVISIFFGLALFWAIRIRIITPIDRLHGMLQDFKVNGTIPNSLSFNDDEVGYLAEENVHMLELIKINTKSLKKLAFTDSLTGLNNRSHFLAVAKKIIDVSERANSKNCIFMMDIDFFKQVNDHYGHPAGDAVLVSTANIIKNRVRKGDLLARFGGEEFIILLHNSSIRDAKVIGEKIRSSIAATPTRVDDLKITTTISIGVCEYDNSKTLEENIAMADKALYSAKNEGRNRVVVYMPSPSESIKQAEAPQKIIPMTRLDEDRH